MDFLELPTEVFINHIICYMETIDFMRFLCTSAGIKDYYDKGEFWRICYLRKKQIEFRENELKKMRRLICYEYDHEGLFNKSEPYGFVYYRSYYLNVPVDLNARCTLVIENRSDVTYKVSFMNPNHNYRNLDVKKVCGIIAPRCKRIISSYIGHIFEISYDYKQRDNYEKSYKTHYVVLKKEGILPEPYQWKTLAGKDRTAQNPVVIKLAGETYDESVKEILDILHPVHSLKNFKDFKKQHKKLYMTKMKKKDKENSEKKRTLNLRITDKKNQLKAMSEQFQQEIFEMESVLKKVEKETLQLDSYFERSE
jgi:hypothetical protein